MPTDESSTELAKEVATAIATYVAKEDDTDLPSVTSNWVLAGVELEDETNPTLQEIDKIKGAILHVPTPFGQKVNIVEMCNKTFASQALGASAVVTGGDATKIVNGYIHATALPCEVSIYVEYGEDGEKDKVVVDMLNPEAIFTLFFTDVLLGEQMLDTSFAAAIQGLPSQVNDEIRTVIGQALIDYGYSNTLGSPVALGPVYSLGTATEPDLSDITEAVANTPYQSPYVHFVYQKANRGDFRDADVSAVAQAIIATASDGNHPRSLDAQLYTDDWKAARPDPLKVPGGNLVIEVCSPINAKIAMGLGLHHATALPCELAVTALDEDGVGGKEALMITYLDPHFMFGALFSDSFDELTEAELADFEMLPTTVYEDLRTIVKAALQRKDIGFTLRRRGQPQQVFFDMLPGTELQ